MTHSPTEAHLASWAGLCPGNNESTGKYPSDKTRKGDRWLRIALTEATLAVIQTKDGALRARYGRIMRHRGHKKTIIAVIHTILRITYHLLSRQVDYQYLGVDYFDHRRTEPIKSIGPSSSLNGKGIRSCCNRQRNRAGHYGRFSRQVHMT